MPIGMVIRAKHIHTGLFCQHVLFKTDRFVFSAVMTDIMKKKRERRQSQEFVFRICVTFGVRNNPNLCNYILSETDVDQCDALFMSMLTHKYCTV